MPNAENIEQRLIAKVKDYLERNGVFYQKSSIDFSGLRTLKMEDGSERETYVLTYLVVQPNQKYDGTDVHFVYADKITEKLLFSIGPQSYTPIEGTW